MPRGLHRLSARTVATAKPGRHSDGGGLYLVVDKSGARRWAFMRWQDRRPTEIGLGSVSKGVTLAMARERAEECRHLTANGQDARLWRAPAKTTPTFATVADDVITSLETGWRNDKHRAQWRSTLATYCRAISHKPIDQISTGDVLAVLQPIWKEKSETASRLRGRIEKILDAAKARGHREGENPARWRGHLDNLLSPRQKLTRGHFASLPWPEVPEFVARLRQREGVACLALEFAILTVARSQEVREARWEEFNLDTRVWTIPPLDPTTGKSRMKPGREHRVPLAPRAIEIIQTMAKLPREPYVFPGQRKSRPLSDMSLSAVLRRMNIPSKVATQHGFRASFKTWGFEATSFAVEIIETAMSHVKSNKVERAYLRGDALERRREVMEQWARFLDADKAENVVLITAPRSIEQRRFFPR